MRSNTSADTPLSTTDRSSLTRRKERGATDRSTLYEVLDEGMICHFGMVLNGSPVVLPTSYGREGDTLYLHGSTGSPTMLAGRTGVDVCVTVTLVDAVVYARSVNDHSMNYRSAVIHGTLRPVTDPSDKTRALRAITDHLAPGSWGYARDVNAKENAAVAVLALDLAEASVKVRSGDPADDPADADGPAWAGVLPVRTSFGAPVAAADLRPGIDLPEHIAERAN